MQAPPLIQTEYEQLLADGRALDLQKRLMQKDAGLWSDNLKVQQSIMERLGWIDSVELMSGRIESMHSVRQELIVAGFDHCVLLGMGGSSLAPELFSKMFDQPANTQGLTLTVLDTTSPDLIDRISNTLCLEKTVFIVASKSGTTIESECLFRHYYAQIEATGIPKPGRHFIAITDAHTELAKLADEKHFRYCFLNPADIGGRFSVLSYFGLVPATLLNVDTALLLQSAAAQRLACRSEDSISEATRLGILLGLAAENGLNKLKLRLSCQLKSFADWLEQLIAESTGKAGKGILPVIETHAAQPGRENWVEIALIDQDCKSEHAILSMCFERERIGAEFFKWEWATAIAAALMNINPFDQPNVGENKKITTQRLESPALITAADPDMAAHNAFVFADDTIITIQQQFKTLIDALTPAGFVALLVYGIEESKCEPVLRHVTDALTTQFGLCTTLGIGPRYLHSTGQLHKGGANNGTYLIISADFATNLPIPGKSFSFAQLNHAQVLGDVYALDSNNRRLLHVHLTQPCESNLRRLTNTLIDGMG